MKSGSSWQNDETLLYVLSTRSARRLRPTRSTNGSTTLRIPEQTVNTIQIDSVQRQVFIKLITNECVQSLLRETDGEAKYKHQNGEMLTVTIAVAGLGTKRVRVANLPPEVNDAVLMNSLAPYEKVIAIQEKMWAKSYRYAIANEVRQVTVMLTRHIPPHLTVAGIRVLLSYDGQLATCYGCAETGHIFETCPKRQHRGPAASSTQRESYAVITAQKDSPREDHTKHEAQVEKPIHENDNTVHISMPVEGKIIGDGYLLMEDDNTQQYDGTLTCSNNVQNNDNDKTTLLQTQPGENTVTFAEDSTDTTKTQTGEEPHGQDNTITQHDQQKRRDDTGAGSERDENTPDTIDIGPYTPPWGQHTRRRNAQP